MAVIHQLHASRLMAIVRGSDRDAALRSVLTLAEEGIDVIEVSLTTAEAGTVISRARDALGPTAMLGAGTVIDVDDAKLAFDAGAGFVVTPGLSPGIAEAQEHDLPVIAGAFTPSEVIEATRRGAQAIKLFPASFGGVAYLRALLDPFPRTPFIPVGGIDANAAGRFLAAGAVAVGVGSPLMRNAASGGSLPDLRERVRAFRKALATAGQP